MGSLPKGASKAEVRQMLGLKSTGKDEEDWARFEWVSHRTYKNKLSLNAEIAWGELSNASIDESLSIVEDDCKKENLDGIVITRPVLEWRLYNLHRSAAKMVVHRSKKAAAPVDTPSTSSPGPMLKQGSAPKEGSKLRYDPVREASGNTH